MPDDAIIFEGERPSLLAHAYRMLGDLARAEDVVQDAWLRWQRREAEVDSPRAYLLTTVTRLCLDELGAARNRHEEPRGDRLPEPVDLELAGLARVERLDRISVAFLVLLQRLTAAERAVFLLHEVFDMSHKEIAGRLGRSEDACRQALKRAKDNVAGEKRVLEASREEHERLFEAFVSAMTTGDSVALEQLLADDSVLVVDPGERTRYGQIRALGGPVVGARRILSVVRAFLSEDATREAQFARRTLNGAPGLVTLVGGRVTSALTIGVSDGRVRHIFVQYDARRLLHISGAN
jgi:RNA polymerase sigma-70 factor, ECF subfamily